MVGLNCSPQDLMKLMKKQYSREARYDSRVCVCLLPQSFLLKLE